MRQYHPNTSGISVRQRVCLCVWSATGIVASGAGPHDLAPANNDNLYGGDRVVCLCCGGGGERVCARACVMCLTYTIIIFDTG